MKENAMSEDINLANMSGDEVKRFIENILGVGKIIHVVGVTFLNALTMRTSKEFLFTQNIQMDKRDEGIQDGNHILLFPQDESGKMCPRSWFMAAWPYLETLHSNFSFFPLEAELYYKVTLIGLPTGDRFGISEEVEKELAKAEWRKVTRINCTSAEELAQALQKRIDANQAFLEE